MSHHVIKLAAFKPPIDLVLDFDSHHSPFTMLNWATIQFLLFLAAPYLIRQLPALFNRRSPQQNSANSSHPPRPRTRYDIAISVLLALAGVYEFLRALVFPPSNLFQFLDLPFDAHPALLRDHLLQHNDSLVATTGLGAEDLFDLLKSSHSRSIIATFGQDALLRCAFCRETEDYMLFVLPAVASTYALVLMIMGLVTITNRKQDLRTYSTIFLVSLGALELYSFMTYTPELRGNVSFYETADRYRRLAFVALMAALWWFERADERTDTEILADIAKEQELMISRAKAQSLQRASVLRDSNLRRIHNDFYRRIEIADGVVSADPEYQSARAQALSRLDVDRLMKEAEAFVGSVVEQGLRTLEPGFGEGAQQQAPGQ